MYGHSLSRRHQTTVQIALALIVLSGLVFYAGGSAAQQALVLTSTQAGTQDLRANLTGIQGSTPAYMAGTQQLHPVSPMQAFDLLNRQAGNSLAATWDAQTGIPRFLTGIEGSVRIPYSPTAAEVGNPLAIARGFLDQNRAIFKLGAVADDFGAARFEPDAQLDFSHIRLPQVYKGVPVFGRQLVVHMDPEQQIVAVNGHYAPGLDISTQPSITRERAEQVATEDLKENQLDSKDAARVQATVLKDKTALTVYIDSAGKPTLTWQVKLATVEPTGEWTIFVNAHRPVVVHAIDGVQHAKRRETYSARRGTDIPGRLMIQEGERSSDAIAQAAHEAAGRVYDYYFQTFKRDSIDGRGIPMVSTVHYGSDPEDAENAAWIGEAQQMIYGDGGSMFKPLAYGLDVVGHEFTHGVTDSTSQLIYEGQSGALNESYSDVFGAMIDRANWTLGEAVVKSPPYPVPYLRSLEDPELRGRYDPSDPLSGVGQPGDMNSYADLPISRRSDYGGVHINSGIPSHAAFFVAQATSKEKMEQIYYRTLTQYLSPDSDFSDAARASVQAATDLYGSTEANAVRDAFRRVGIDPGGTQTEPTPPAGSTTTPTPATPVPAPAPSGQNLPAGCRELVANGSFEGSGGWEEVTSGGTQIIDPQQPHTGSQSAWLGGTDKESVLYIYQDVAIPANATSAKLSYYRLLHEEFTGLSGLFASDAEMRVLLADADGNEIANIETLSSSDADDTWKQAQFDLARYAGKTIRLVYTADNPRGNVSSFFIDDVTLPACTTGQGPAAPSTSSNDQVYIQGHIVNSDTGRGISGAQIFILRQGLSATSAAQDDEVTDDEVLTFGTADSQGRYQTEDPIQRGKRYSVIIIAGGYRPVIADNGMTVPATASNPTQIDASMRPAR
ncbi:MAG TPA: M4 family metallopeptidase [Chloroflexia bacterium]|nr:M4 family metallopeptidase [Chloroflexia bacterium]